MELRANKKGRRRDHWQSKPGSCHQACRSDPTGDDDLIGVKAAGICLDTNDMTGRQIQRTHRIVRNDRRAKALRGGKQGLRSASGSTAPSVGTCSANSGGVARCGSIRCTSARSTRRMS